MAYDVIVDVQTSFTAQCSLSHDPGASLSDYMQLPVDQYVCIRMPLDANLDRIGGNRFNLTVPPVRFFTLDVSPTMLCNVSQDAGCVLIESRDCILRGSPYVVSLNGCYNLRIRTAFSWTDTPERKEIRSDSRVYVEVPAADADEPACILCEKIMQDTRYM